MITLRKGPKERRNWLHQYLPVQERSGVLRVFPFTSLQILTQEDWNVVLYNGMASTSSWAALYFVALMTFGNYVLFNLLVAILVEGFQAEVRDLSRGREKAEKHTCCGQM